MLWCVHRFPGKVRYDIGYTEYDALRFATEEPDYELYIITGDDLNDISASSGSHRPQLYPAQVGLWSGTEPLWLQDR